MKLGWGRTGILITSIFGSCGMLSAQTSTITCRPLDGGNAYLYPDEQVVGNQACKTVANTAHIQQQQVAQAGPAVAANQTAADVPTGPATTPSVASGPSANSFVGTMQPPHPGSRVAIAPMGGFETYFAAAIREKQVPLAITLDRDTAQFFLVSTETEWQGFVYASGGGASWNQSGGSAAHGSTASSTRGLEASIMLIDAKTKDVVWAYEVHKSSHGALLLGTHASRGQQSLAEACAKHLKEFIEKSK
jgi:hypothetical protein